MQSGSCQTPAPADAPAPFPSAIAYAGPRPDAFCSAFSSLGPIYAPVEGVGGAPLDVSGTATIMRLREGEQRPEPAAHSGVGMAGTEPSAIGRVIIDLVEVLVEVDDSLQAINDANAEYSRRWRQVNEALGVIPLDNPLAEFPTLWDWYSRCQGDLDTGDVRHQFLEALSARALQTSGVLSVAPPAYTIEMFEHDGNPDDVPYLRWFFHEISRPKQLAAKAGVERILAYLGSGVIDTEWGDNLQDGVCELRIKRTAAETEPWWRNHYGLPEPEPEPHVEILLRIYFHAYGDKVILLLGGFDKGAHPNHEKAEVKQAKANLRNWREQQARAKAR